MHCMKCGAEAPENQVFCDHCLSIMDQYPVKPDIHIHLPKRAASPDPSKKAPKKKRTLTSEEQISALRLQIRRLRLAVIILIFALCIAGGFLVLNLYQQQQTPVTGRNYTIDTTMNS